MKKTLTIKVPNQLWVDDFTENKTAKFQYDGPSKIWVKSVNGTLVPTVYEEEPESDPTEATKIFPIEISTASETELAVAILLVHAPDPVEYVFEDEINYDGTVYGKITNPKLNDYYVASATSNELSIVVNTKDQTVQNEEIAIQRKNYVTKYTSVYSFDSADQAKIDAFLTEIDSYLESMKTVYPWKHVAFNDDVPKIPVSIVSLFNSLPDLK